MKKRELDLIVDGWLLVVAEPFLREGFPTQVTGEPEGLLVVVDLLTTNH
jgi:hypothetical protein